MKGIWAVVRMSFLTYVRDRSAMFWGILFPVLLMGLIGSVFGDSALHFDVVAVVPRSTAGSPSFGPSFGEAFITALKHMDLFTVREETLEVAMKDLEQGRASLVVVLPEAPAAWPVGSEPLPVTVYHDAASQSAQAGVAVIREVANRFDQSITGRPARVTVTAEARGGQGFSMFDYLLPGIIAMTLMQTGLMGVTWVVANYREQKVLKRVLTTPFRPGGFLAGLIGRFTVVNLFQAAIIFLVGTYVFHARTQGDLLQYAVVAAWGSVAFLALGMAISTVSRTAEAASNLGNLVAFPMMFLSGVFWPREMMPEVLQPFLGRLPLSPLVDALRAIASGTGTLFDHLGGLGYLTLWMVAAMAVAVWRFRWE
ncbi:ABC transporter permease [Limnochorda pilosa]|uniref:ABC transporter permease n=1 Tax=Limnochorda pilosa TaxID=1555112 RepID=A0A0K2SJE0_LIMPI|nr:ABC transporter permease [Limnochorda pilosa]BAS27218.1 ABC transporter permease [Limnochorda pilosa]